MVMHTKATILKIDVLLSQVTAPIANANVLRAQKLRVGHHTLLSIG